MKNNFLKVLFLIMILSLIFLQSIVVHAQNVSTAPSASNITITNNASIADVIYVTGLYGGETIKVYDSASGGKFLGTARVSSIKTEATIKITQLGTSAGSIYVSLTNPDELESSRTEVSYSAEVQSSALNSGSVIITNNVGEADVIYITDLYGGETINVYNALKDGKLLGSAKVSTAKSEATIKITQLGISAGSVYVTVTNEGELESSRTEVAYLGEAESDSPNTEYITITNYAGADDTIRVNYLSPGDKVKVYSSNIGGTLLGSAPVPPFKTEVTLSISQIGRDAGSVYISLTYSGMRESERVQVNFSAEAKSPVPSEKNITVTNNANQKDTITVTGLTKSDLIRVYDSASGGIELGSATVSNSKTEGTVSISQLGTDDGTVYVTITRKGYYESDRTECDYSEESTSDSSSDSNITITNNSGSSDTIEVTGLSTYDVVRVYDSSSGGTLLGSATVSKNKTKATVSISQLGTSAGNVYITITSKGSLESSRNKVHYSAEPVSDAINDYDVTVVNNPEGKSDTVTVESLTYKDLVKVYDKAKNGNVLGSATVSRSKTEVTISITQLGEDSGSIYVSVTSSNKTESSRVEVKYSSESQTAAVDEDDIIVTNNVSGTSDTIEVTSLSEGDLVKVFDSSSGGSLLGSSTIDEGSTSTIISITQLGEDAGSVYVSITSSGESESERIKVEYSAESVSNAVDSSDVAVTNNADTSDTVEVTGLTSGDIINVYSAAKGGILLGTATVADYSTYATVTIDQLGTDAGSIYVSITSTNKIESARVEINYDAESQTDTADSNNIIITNNAGNSDIVQVTGLNTDDVVKVYDAAKGGSVLGTATVTDGTTITISISQLGTSAGSIYVTITSSNEIESERVQCNYDAESQSDAPSVDNIEIDNKVDTSDIIKITGLAEEDEVNIYDAAKAGNLLGSATVDTYESSVSITVTQLSTTSGYIYVTVTSTDKLESKRTAVQYSAEPQTEDISTDNVTITNNAGISDLIEVTGINGGDVVNVYDAATVGDLLGTATADTYDTSVSITITQLSSEAGSIYITVTSTDERESNRTKVNYDAESQSESPSASNVIIVNNAGVSDTVKVKGLNGGDEVNIYNKSSSGTLLGTATVGTYDSYATVSIDQLGSTSGTIYVTVTESGYLESDRVAVEYSAEPETDAADSSYITVTNNARANDTIKVTGLDEDDIVYVYESESGEDLLGSGTVEEYASSVTIEVSQLGSSSGSVYVSIKRTGKLESSRTKVSYAAEQHSDAPFTSNITVTNNADISDTVEVCYLDEGDIVKVYDAEEDGNLLGTATVEDDETEVTVTISQIGSSSGSVYVSITSENKLESSRTEVNYKKESTTNAPDVNDITVNNYATLDDTVTVSYLEPDDIVYVYSKESGGSLLGSGVVEDDSTEVTITLDDLDSSGGSIYVSVKTVGENESSRVEVEYGEEEQSDMLSASNISIKNNAKGTSDTITVSYLDEYDVVKVYSSESGGSTLGSATVEEDDNEVTITISQLGTTSGKVYVSVKNYGMLESDRTVVYYAAEVTSDAVDADDVTIVNNSSKSDTITIINLTEYDVVNIYSSSSGTTLLGTGTVDEDESEITIKISQLGTSSGYVYITITSEGCYESDMTKVSYGSE